MWRVRLASQLDLKLAGLTNLIPSRYRRGKQLSNDIDLIITYPHQEGKERGVLKKLLRRLQQKGELAGSVCQLYIC